jgi:hypothetical protein
MNKKMIRLILVCLLLLTITTGCCQQDRQDPIYIICRIFYPSQINAQVDQLPSVTQPAEIGPAQDTVENTSLP